ncbi:MAG: hypothetical protein JSV12_05250 [Candidatus Bathyarchaeota archaeon]|nr:MAG: hypothetical protein JSV12_05250 [Candidatus Bathyarchaeota archaeon]
MSFVLFSIPFFIFANALTDLGEFRIVFKELILQISDTQKRAQHFNQRQKWMKKFFERLEEQLRIARIKVKSDKLVYICNLKLMNSEEITENLKNLGNWILGEKTENVLSSFKKIFPDEEIKPIEKTSQRLLDKFVGIPKDVRKYIFLAIILVFVAVFKPEWIEGLVSKLF